MTSSWKLLIQVDFIEIYSNRTEKIAQRSGALCFTHAWVQSLAHKVPQTSLRVTHVVPEHRWLV